MQEVDESAGLAGSWSAMGCRVVPNGRTSQRAGEASGRSPDKFWYSHRKKPGYQLKLFLLKVSCGFQHDARLEQMPFEKPRARYYPGNFIFESFEVVPITNAVL
jgi:hypothetical protein